MSPGTRTGELTRFIRDSAAITSMKDMRDAVILHAPNGPRFQRSDERVHHDQGPSSVLAPASRRIGPRAI